MKPNMTSNEARGLILEELGRTPLSDLYQPGTRITYPPSEIVSILLRRLPDDVRDYYTHANNLSRASIHAVVERAVRERYEHVRTGGRRRR